MLGAGTSEPLKKRVWIFIVIYPVTHSFLLNGEFNYGMEGGKFICMIRWEGW